MKAHNFYLKADKIFNHLVLLVIMWASIVSTGYAYTSSVYISGNNLNYSISGRHITKASVTIRQWNGYKIISQNTWLHNTYSLSGSLPLASLLPSGASYKNGFYRVTAQAWGDGGAVIFSRTFLWINTDSAARYFNNGSVSATLSASGDLSGSVYSSNPNVYVYRLDVYLKNLSTGSNYYISNVSYNGTSTYGFFSFNLKTLAAQRGLAPGKYLVNYRILDSLNHYSYVTGPYFTTEDKRTPSIVSYGVVHTNGSSTVKPGEILNIKNKAGQSSKIQRINVYVSPRGYGQVARFVQKYPSINWGGASCYIPPNASSCSITVPTGYTISPSDNKVVGEKDYEIYVYKSSSSIPVYGKATIKVLWDVEVPHVTAMTSGSLVTLNVTDNHRGSLGGLVNTHNPKVSLYTSGGTSLIGVIMPIETNKSDPYKYIYKYDLNSFAKSKGIAFGDYSLNYEIADTFGNVVRMVRIPWRYEDKPPVLTSYKVIFSDGTLKSGTDITLRTSKSKTQDIKSLQFFVEKRQYPQTISAGIWGSCSIPAGATTCSISAKPTDDVWSLPRNNPIVGETTQWFYAYKSQDSQKQSNKAKLRLEWDAELPIFQNVKTVDHGNTLYLEIRDPHKGSINGTVQLQSVFLDLLDASGQKVMAAGVQPSYKGTKDALTYVRKWNLKQLLTDRYNLPSGKYKLRLIAQDTYGNKSIYHIDWTVDKTPPVITFYGPDRTTPLSGSSLTLDMLDNLYVRVSDNIDPQPSIQKVTMASATAGSGGLMVLPKPDQSQQGPALINYENAISTIIKTPEDKRSFRITVTAIDTQGNAANKSLTINFDLKKVGFKISDTQEVSIPAIDQPVLTRFGEKAFTTATVQWKDKNGTLNQLQSAKVVYARLSSDSETPITIAGTVVNPGEIKEISGYRVTPRSSLEIPLAPANAAQAANKRANLTVTIIAQGAPILEGSTQIRFWKPAGTFEAPERIVQGFTKVSLRPVAIQQQGVPTCQFTFNEMLASHADMVNDPICLIEIDEKPSSLNAVENSVGDIELIGRLYQDALVSYNIFIFDADGNKHQVAHVAKDFAAAPAFGAVSMEVVDAQTGSSQNVFVKRMITDKHLALKLNDNELCEVTVDPTLAEASVNSLSEGSKPYCLVELQDPVGFKVKANGAMQGKLPLEISSVPASATSADLSWKIYLYKRDGSRFVLNEQTKPIPAKDPNPIIIDDGSSTIEKTGIVPTDINKRPKYMQVGNRYAPVIPITGRKITYALKLLGENAASEVTVTGLNNVLTQEASFDNQIKPVEVGNTTYDHAETWQYTFSAAGLNAWDVKNLYLSGRYKEMPDKEYRATYPVVIAPSTEVKPVAEIDNKTVLDDAAVNINLEIASLNLSLGTYNPAIFGKWDYRAYLTSRRGVKVPLTDWSPIPESGKTQVTVEMPKVREIIQQLDAQKRKEIYESTKKKYLDAGASEQQADYYATKARDNYRGPATQTVWGINFEIKQQAPSEAFSVIKSMSSPLLITLMPSKPIDGELKLMKASGPVPFNLKATLTGIDASERLVLGAVEWYLSSDGVNWEKQQTRNPLATGFVMKIDQPGIYYLKAITINKLNGKRYTSAVLKVTTYNAPGKAIIEGPKNILVGESATLYAHLERRVLQEDPQTHRKYFKTVTIKGADLTNQYDIQWSVGRNSTDWKPTNAPQPDAFIVEGGDKPENLAVNVLLKDKLASNDDMAAQAKGVRYLSFVYPKQPYVSLNGPYQIVKVDRRLPNGETITVEQKRTFLTMEKGRTYYLDAQVVLPYRDMQGRPAGVAILPDGQEIDLGSEAKATISYTPTSEDVEKGLINFTLKGWIEGYKDATLRVANKRARAWQYVFPDFDLLIRKSSDYAPADVSVEVRPVGVSLSAVEDVNFEWTLPDDANVTRKMPTRIYMTFDQAGQKTIKVRVTDSRGNETVVEKTITLAEPPPLEPTIKYSQSNQYGRAPLKVILRTYVKGGHPRDRIQEYVYYLDGKEFYRDDGYIARTTLDAGEHTIKVKVNSKLGYTAENEINIKVVPNKPPVCNLKVSEYSTSWTFRADCRDEDGRIVGYSWTLDGKDLAVSSSAISVSKHNRTGTPVVTVKAKDDAGDYSAVVGN